MNIKKYNYCVFIARLQPPHKAHLQIISEALKISEYVIVVLGSHRAAPDIKNPWSTEQRQEMVLRCFSKEEQDRIVFCPVRDQIYNDTNWLTEVHQKATDIIGEDNKSVAIIGHRKDRSSEYLSFFPQWDLIDVGNYLGGLNATEIRSQYFGFGIDNWANSSLDKEVQNWLLEFQQTKEYKSLKESFEFIQGYKKLWSNSPFPPTFVTVDTVVIKSGHVLLVKRKANPGSGLYALPGGFINQEELIVDSALRELREETRIELDKKTLREMIKDQHVFDHPDRSTRGRTITHAYLIKIPDGGPLPKVKGDDDAEKAFWVPLGELPFLEHLFYEDHLQIISYFTKV